MPDLRGYVLSTPKLRISVATLVALAVLASAIPVVYMVGCSMNMRGTDCIKCMSFSDVGATISQACTGVWQVSGTAAGLASATMAALLFALMLALAASIRLVVAPGAGIARVLAVAKPPPRQLPALGMRLSI